MKRSSRAAPTHNPDGSVWALRVATGTPGAVVEQSEIGEGVIAERNGAGSVVALLYPHGIEGVIWGEDES